ncbi:Thiol-disulfide oxidoreductase ResA [Pirellulimonas nuda]|uniref:Thiol-disulfide oxidoreductase ResA n=1 Tax=Pirellulimonas nuda TaxID=2528009 RepID=A0A518DHW5_9BACT|nr:redoxin domain-containing protein [Pirellulimonas nuda]QDU91065.1 Thiol-disulfide oxidoreductase ResA [Pirellulimonas nuda]
MLRSLSFVALLGVCLPFYAWADEAETSEAKTVVAQKPAEEEQAEEMTEEEAEASAEKARAVLMAAAKHVSQQPSASVTMEYTVSFKMGERGGEQATKYLVALAGPNRFSVVDPDGPFFIKSDGDDMMTRFQDKFVVEAAPKSIAEALQNRVLGMLANGDASTALNLVSPESAKPLLAAADLAYEGQQELDGEKVDVVSADFRGRPWKLFVTTGDSPTLVRAEPDMSKRISPQQRKAGLEVTAGLNFSDWQFDAPATSQAFVLSIPKKAEFVESLFGGGDEPHPLLGEQAPTFTLATDGGEDVDLADLVGEKIIILDFWATWCGPCVRAFPALTTVADDFADKGVVFYAVNQREDEEKVAAFLEDKDYSLNVLYDVEGEVGSEFGVSGIPQSVVIGKDGKVQVVHVGFSPDLEKKLTKELNALVEGKDLAAEAVIERQRIEAERAERLAELEARFAKKRAAAPVGS